MSIVAVIGAFLQLLLLVLPRIFSAVDSKKSEAKELYGKGIQAIKDRDASELTATFDKLRNI